MSKRTVIVIRRRTQMLDLARRHKGKLAAILILGAMLGTTLVKLAGS